MSNNFATLFSFFNTPHDFRRFIETTQRRARLVSMLQANQERSAEIQALITDEDLRLHLYSVWDALHARDALYNATAAMQSLIDVHAAHIIFNNGDQQVIELLRTPIRTPVSPDPTPVPPPTVPTPAESTPTSPSPTQSQSSGSSRSSRRRARRQRQATMIFTTPLSHASTSTSHTPNNSISSSVTAVNPLPELTEEEITQVMEEYDMEQHQRHLAHMATYDSSDDEHRYGTGDLDDEALHNLGLMD